MDEGLPIAYEALQTGVPVYVSTGEEVGTVDRVLAAPEEDIFHGILLGTGGSQRFVAADQIASLHERRVDLRIDAAAVERLPGPEAGAPAQRVREPGVKPTWWRRAWDLLSGADPRKEDWTEED